MKGQHFLSNRIGSILSLYSSFSLSSHREAFDTRTMRIFRYYIFNVSTRHPSVISIPYRAQPRSAPQCDGQFFVTLITTTPKMKTRWSNEVGRAQGHDKSDTQLLYVSEATASSKCGSIPPCAPQKNSNRHPSGNNSGRFYYSCKPKNNFQYTCPPCDRLLLTTDECDRAVSG